MTPSTSPRAARSALSPIGRAQRLQRIFTHIREDLGYYEVARAERLTAVRGRQVVLQALVKRIVEDGRDHAKGRLARLRPSRQLAGEAVADGDGKAIAPLLDALDRVDRYERVANASQVYDGEARKKLFDKINRGAADLGAYEEPPAAKAAARSERDGRVEGRQRKTLWGVRASP